MADTFVTRDGYEKLRQKLESLKELKRQLSQEIGEAAAQGDLRENFAYTAAKQRQAETLRKILEVETKLRTARLIEELNMPKDEVRIGVKVTLKDSTGDVFSYSLVGAEESDPVNGKISVYAPLAEGLLGHKEGESVKVSLPSGSETFHILKIEYI